MGRKKLKLVHSGILEFEINTFIYFYYFFMPEVTEAVIYLIKINLTIKLLCNS